jgi:hypothetical protein
VIWKELEKTKKMGPFLSLLAFSGITQSLPVVTEILQGVTMEFF